MQTPPPKQQFLDAFRREASTTVKVLKAYPADKADLRPAPKSKTARELAWVFVMEQGMLEKAADHRVRLVDADARKAPSAPESFDAIIAAFDGGLRRVVDLVEKMSD